MKKFLHENGILLVVIAVLLAAVLAVGSALMGINPVTSVLNAVGAPFRSLAASISEWSQERYDRAFRYDELETENELLRRRIAELEESARTGEDAQRENERLRDLLGLSNEQPDLVFQEAEVTSRSTTNWGSELTLSKGTGRDVAVGDCVVDQYGSLVGVITEVGPNWSLVTTVLDPDSALGGRVARTDDDVVAVGDFTLMKEGLLKLSYLPGDSSLREGDQVITSGLGNNYPAGLVIGTIRSVYTEADGISRSAEVEPGADIAGIRYVYIITDFGEAG